MGWTYVKMSIKSLSKSEVDEECGLWGFRFLYLRLDSLVTLPALGRRHFLILRKRNTDAKMQTQLHPLPFELLKPST